MRSSGWLGLALALPLFLLGGASCASSPDADEAGAADALSAAEEGWSTEARLAGRFRSEIEPYFTAHAKPSSFTGVDGVPIRTAELLAPSGSERAAIVVFTGRTESFAKYAEVAFDLHRHGYSLYFFDHRGQGFSGRMLPDHDKGYVKSFSDYVTDATTFIDTVVAPRHHANLFALGHSMGGMILGNYLLEHPTTFRAAAFTSPMWKIKFSPWVGGELGAELFSHFGDGTAYAPGQGPYRAGRPNVYQHSPTRFALFYDALETEFPEIRLGGPTRDWLVQAINGGQNVRDHAAALELPFLLFQGELDSIVDNAGEDTVCAKAKHCRKVVVVGGGHEPLMENDTLRSPLLDELTSFYDSQRH